MESETTLLNDFRNRQFKFYNNSKQHFEEEYDEFAMTEHNPFKNYNSTQDDGFGLQKQSTTFTDKKSGNMTHIHNSQYYNDLFGDTALLEHLD